MPKSILRSIKVWNTFFLIAFLFQLFAWALALYQVGTDVDQGDVYRIIFVHVPVAWCAFFWIFFGAFYGILGLVFKNKMEYFDRSSHAAIELGALFSFLVLITGSLWGRPTWGVWWDWDPRLTSSFVMFLVSGGYLITRHFTPDIHAKRQSSAILAILSAVNVPLVYYSVNLWRSLHQPQTFVQSSKNASIDIVWILFLNFLAMFILSIAIYKIRRQSLSALETLESARASL
jgi:heme exporter protein C